MLMVVVFPILAIVSDIDSDYTSDVNFPLTHHNNIPLHQFGGRKPPFPPSISSGQHHAEGRGHYQEENMVDHPHDFFHERDYDSTNECDRRNGDHSLYGEVNYQYEYGYDQMNGSKGQLPHSPYDYNGNNDRNDSGEYMYSMELDATDPNSDYVYDSAGSRSPTSWVSSSNTHQLAADKPMPMPRKSVVRDSGSPSLYAESGGERSEPMSYNSQQR